jgi:hypothetical protein
MCESYSGFKNRETWATALWINNDEGLLSIFTDHLETRVEVEGVEDEDNEIVTPADWHQSYEAQQAAKDWAETYLTPDGYAHEFGDDWPKGLAEVASDIGSLYRVDWFEVCEAVLGE